MDVRKVEMGVEADSEVDDHTDLLYIQEFFGNSQFFLDEVFIGKCVFFISHWIFNG